MKLLKIVITTSVIQIVIALLALPYMIKISGMIITGLASLVAAGFFMIRYSTILAEVEAKHISHQ